ITIITDPNASTAANPNASTAADPRYRYQQISSPPLLSFILIKQSQATSSFSFIIANTTGQHHRPPSLLTKFMIKTPKIYSVEQIDEVLDIWATYALQCKVQVFEDNV
ncbi:hypothetical protein KSS87_023021, partial [Heliosperma pusillum]